MCLDSKTGIWTRLLTMYLTDHKYGLYVLHWGTSLLTDPTAIVPLLADLASTFCVLVKFFVPSLSVSTRSQLVPLSLRFSAPLGVCAVASVRGFLVVPQTLASHMRSQISKGVVWTLYDAVPARGCDVVSSTQLLCAASLGDMLDLRPVRTRPVRLNVCGGCRLVGTNPCPGSRGTQRASRLTEPAAVRHRQLLESGAPSGRPTRVALGRLLRHCRWLHLPEGNPSSGPSRVT